MRGSTGQIQAKIVVSMLSSLDDYLHAKNPRYKLIPLRYIDNQRILQSVWTRDTAGRTHPTVVVSNPTFP